MNETFLVRVRFKADVGYRELVGWLLRYDGRKLHIKPIGGGDEERVSRADLEELDIMGAIYGD